MRAKIWRDAALLVLLCIIGWGVFAWLSPERGSLSTMMTREQESRLGAVLADMIESRYTVLDDNPWQPALDQIAQRLRAVHPESGYYYTIKVLDEELPNAFATLDGQIYFFRGLLELADSPEEIAAVMAHEMAHVEKRHVVKKLISEFGLAVLTGLVTGGDAVIAGEILHALSAGAFSRRQEREADDFALATLFKAGIHPAHLGAIFRKLQQEYPDSQAQIELLNSHPDMASRIQLAMSYPAEGLSEKALEVDWPVKARLPAHRPASE